MRRNLISILSFCLFSSFALAQLKGNHRRNHASFGRSKPPYRYELIGGLGATNFLGDLGGANQIGTHGFKDLNLALTRPAVTIGFRFKIAPNFSVKNNLCWGILSGNDALTQEQFRHARNLNFRSQVWELSTQLEYNFVKEQKGHVYKIKGVRGMQHKDRQFYLFVGGGVFHFHPYGEWNGKWYDLPPLHTENVSYSLYSAMISTGGGLRFAINRYWGVGFEVGLRYTFTDYLDDVSGNYPSVAWYQTASATAQHFSNPSLLYPGAELAGQQRGDPTHKDAYMFGCFTVGYKVMYK